MSERRPRAPYQTLARGLRHEGERVKNSRFIVELRRCSDEAQARAAVTAMRAEFADAGHHCWAFRLYQGGAVRSSDDGEPGGSAGRPMLAMLMGRGLHDVVAVVTRYFGGTKLGVGGLARAYGGAVAKALDLAELEVVTPRRALILEHAYEQTTAVTTTLVELGLAPTESDYGAAVRLRLEVPDAELEAARAALIERCSGRLSFFEED